MKITVVGRQMNVYEEMKLLIEKKLAKFDKFFPSEGDATVTLSSKHNERNIENWKEKEKDIFGLYKGDDKYMEYLKRVWKNEKEES